MMHKFPLTEYRLSNGVIFKPAEFPAADLSLRQVLPDYEVSEDETVKVLYNHLGAPLTLSGHWDEVAKDWIFEVQFGLSGDGEFMKKLM